MVQRLFVPGGLLAFGISTAILLSLNLLRLFSVLGNSPLVVVEGFLVFLVSSVIASLLVTRSLKQGIEISALKTGLFAFALNITIMVFLGTVAGAVWMFAGYVSGSLTGAVIRRITSHRKRNIGQEKPN